MRAEAPMPDTRAPILRPSEAIVIQLNDSGEANIPKLTINTREVAWDSLEAKLRDVYAKRIDKTAFLKGDPDVEFRYVAEALDTIHRAGAERVGLMEAAEGKR